MPGVYRKESCEIRTLVNGRSSSVMRSSLEDVWCILRGFTGARLCGRVTSEDSLLLGASCAGRLFELSKKDV